jgi:hypothetical protein
LEEKAYLVEVVLGPVGGTGSRHPGAEEPVRVLAD